MKVRTKIQTKEITMLIRTTIALALVLASASGSLAAQKNHSNDPAYRASASGSLAVQKKHSNDPAYRAFASGSLATQNSGSLAAQRKHSTNPAYDVYNVRGQYVGSDPDATVRAQIARDPAAE
jgi:hypothetical protein